MRKWFSSSAWVLVAAGLVAGSGVATADVQQVDWHNAEFEVPQVGSCPRQVVSFTDGAGEAGDRVYRFTPDKPIGYADVTGEGLEDALMLIECGPRDSEYSRALIGMTTDPGGTVPRTLGTVVSPPVWTQVPEEFQVFHHDIAVWINDFDTGQGHTEHYRWASSAQAFVRIDGQ
ncbi:hypothetical protein E1161_19615 [Saccharopolyspora aridisoli]|uniref:PLAT domain-containing protein n=1 Tax=Saccharopolyspora aridisoli TaxID=2530385 RepID=A0A4R4ULW7_9PSEU|nr:hypothetical protein [Saccharopolyspora aridisoli]TDC90104.1 hypothetical protein E1161_19615 [Saccharopolyspora aridisoli]